jgi:hypothetical protein
LALLCCRASAAVDFVADQRGAHARHLVGGDAHADARGANQHAEFRLARCATLCATACA